jgi:hypothetical protein
MGREIRRVPPDWQHPLKNNRNYQPVRDMVYEDALLDWESERPSPGDNDALLEWNDSRPNPEYYRHQRWTSQEATAYQIYETISEGTPISPVFQTEEELIKYLVEDGRGMGIGGECFKMTETEAKLYISNGGFAFTMISINGKIMGGVEAAVRYLKTDKD